MHRMNIARVVVVGILSSAALGVGCGGDDNQTGLNRRPGSTPGTTEGSPAGAGGTEEAPAPSAATPGTPAAPAAPATPGTPTTPVETAPGATIFEQFNGWTGNTSPDGIWRIAGTWVGTGGNTLEPENVAMTGGLLTLTSLASSKRGAELQTLTTYGYGYYETSMQVASTPGICDSFFWIQDGYGPREWDVEFLTNEPWVGTPDTGKVHLTLHPSEKSVVIDLPFNPSKALHRYGFLWKAGTIDFTVDGTVVKSFADASLSSTAKGFIMMNSWSSGDPNWGGGPPTKNAVTTYDWVKLYENAAAIP
jgi:beta-glucanase (GH16 family)